MCAQRVLGQWRIPSPERAQHVLQSKLPGTVLGGRSERSGTPFRASLFGTVRNTATVPPPLTVLRPPSTFSQRRSCQLGALAHGRRARVHEGWQLARVRYLARVWRTWHCPLASAFLGPQWQSFAKRPAGEAAGDAWALVAPGRCLSATGTGLSAAGRHAPKALLAPACLPLVEAFK